MRADGTVVGPTIDPAALALADYLVLWLDSRGVTGHEKTKASIWAYQYAVLNTEEISLGIMYPSGEEVVRVWNATRTTRDLPDWVI